VSIPAPRQLRARLRRARRGHHARSLGDFLTDVYILAWLLVMYGGALVNTARQYLHSPSGGRGDPVERYWIAGAALVALAGLAWQALRALGPLLTTPAAQAWCVSTPVDRRGWLLPRLAALLLAAACGGALVGLLVAGLGMRASLAWTALAGVTMGVAGAALSVAAQGAPRRRWPRLVGVVVTGLGALAAGVVVAAHFGAYPLHRPDASLGPALVAAGLPLALVSTTLSVRVLPRLDRAALNAGAQLATAATTAVIWLDPSLLAGVLEVRRWRRVGRVRSRRFLPIGRLGVLVQAEVRRQGRHPSALAVWAALALAQYAVAVAVPAAAGVAHLIGAYLAANRLTGGLRTLSRSPGLRRALGGGETELRLVHLVVPAIGAGLWWLVTAPAGAALAGSVQVLMVLGVIAAVYRAATRPAMAYGGAVVETPFGLIPVDLLRQLGRGPDVLAVLVIAQSLLW